MSSPIGNRRIGCLGIGCLLLIGVPVVLMGLECSVALVRSIKLRPQHQVGAMQLLVGPNTAQVFVQVERVDFHPSPFASPGATRSPVAIVVAEVSAEGIQSIRRGILPQVVSLQMYEAVGYRGQVYLLPMRSKCSDPDHLYRSGERGFEKMSSEATQAFLASLVSPGTAAGRLSDCYDTLLKRQGLSVAEEGWARFNIPIDALGVQLRFTQSEGQERIVAEHLEKGHSWEAVLVEISHDVNQNHWVKREFQDTPIAPSP